ncbi:hypothetical protein thalar_00705 [Litoreibacter arenae DSM 19593]|uniref:Uncharacterized protein n=2 Tax=Litoreibacter TaxID=947567 RepID=S9RT51_9RHOB|nr:hypothetical protein thalar_00705 [Litoreibacter arenae DSM 19593]
MVAGMVEISEITDRKSLEAWLLEQDDPKAVSAIIAHRAAMRVLPIAWQWFSKVTHKSDMATLRVLRAPLTSEVACFATIFVAAPIAAARAADVAVTYAGTAADTAAARDDTVARADAAAARAAASAISHAAKVSGAADAAAEPTLVAIARVAAAEYSTSINLNIWPHIRRDCSAYLAGEDFTSAHLWPGDGNPLAQVWEALKKDLSKPAGSEATARGETGLDWSFWIDWYDRALTGTEDRWDMLTEIALLDSKVWEGEASVLMDEINKIWRMHSAAAAPNGEELSVNSANGRYRVTPAVADTAELYAETRGKLSAVLSLPAFQEPLENQYTALREELDMLRNANATHDDAPRMLHSTCVRARARLRVKFQNEVCPTPEEDANSLDLLGSVEEVISDLVSQNEKVKQAVIAKAKVSFELHGDRAEIIAEADMQLAEISEGLLATQMPELAEVIRDPSASDDEKAEALYVSAARLLRVGVIEAYKGSKSVVGEIEWWSERGVKLTVNAGKIVGASAAVTSPLWLENALKVILTLL